MYPDIDLKIIGEYFVSDLEEVSFNIYNFPTTSPAYCAGGLATAAWHLNLTGGVKIVVRIADTDEHGTIIWYPNGIRITNSLKSITGFLHEMLLAAETAILHGQQGIYVCWKRSSMLG